jgi:hypothetical protein
MLSFNGGFCPPGRFVVPVLILLALPLALVIERRIWIAPVMLLGAASLAAAVSVARAPNSSLYPEPSRREWPVVVESALSRAFPVTPETIYPRSTRIADGMNRAIAPTDGAGSPFASGPIPVLSPASYIASFDVEVSQGALRLEIAQRGNPLAATEVTPTTRTTVRVPFVFPAGATDLDARASATTPSAAALHGVAIKEAPHPRPLWLKSLAWLGALVAANLVVARVGGRRPRTG